MRDCPLCESELSPSEFQAVLLEDRHGIGQPPADSTNWSLLRRTLRAEYGIEVPMAQLMAHADEHIGYM